MFLKRFVFTATVLAGLVLVGGCKKPGKLPPPPDGGEFSYADYNGTQVPYYKGYYYVDGNWMWRGAGKPGFPPPQTRPGMQPRPGTQPNPASVKSAPVKSAPKPASVKRAPAKAPRGGGRAPKGPRR